MQKHTARFGGSLLVIGLASATYAQVIPFTDRPTWTAAIGGVSGTENFNAFAVDTSFQNVFVALNNMTVTGTPGSNGLQTQKVDAPPLEFSNFYSWDGTSQILADVAGVNQFMRINFTQPMTAWGGDFTGISDPGRTTVISVFNSANTLLGTVTPVSPDGNSPLFFGFNLGSGSASYITFVNNDAVNNDVFGIDNIGFKLVPEPATLGVLAVSSLLLSARRMRAPK